MTGEPRSFPERPRSHVVGDSAVNAFKFKGPQEWNITPTTSDYGWDLSVEIPESGKMKGMTFCVQLKGTERPDFVDDNNQISFPLKVSTVNFLLEKLEPSMIAVCDTTDSDQPIYWVWLNEAIEAVSSVNPVWKTQETVSIRLPVSNKLSRSDTPAVVEHVRKHHNLIKVGQRVAEVLGLGSEANEPSVVNLYRTEPKRFVSEQVLPQFVEAGLVDAFDTSQGEAFQAFSSEDQDRFRKLKEIARSLDDLRDRDAERLLNEMGTTINSAADGVKARYWNCRGILALHQSSDREALNCYEKALGLRPLSKKYITNQLFLRYHMQRKSYTGEPPAMDKNWIDSLEALLHEHPDFSPAIRLKAYWISELEGPEVATDYLSSTPAWENDKLLTRECAADIYRDAGLNVQALSLLEEAEAYLLSSKPVYWSMRAFVLMRLALDDRGTSPELELQGYGPKHLNFVYLKKAFESYTKAIAGYREIGFPRLAEPSVTNFAVVAGLLNKLRASEEACRLFIEYHPDSNSVAESLASALLYQKRSSEAVDVLRPLHQRNPLSSRYFKNLILCQLVSEEFVDLLVTARKREESGFLNSEEEGVARSLVAVALAELGEQGKAYEQIAILRSRPQLANKAYIAEGDVLWRTKRDLTEVMQIYKKGLAAFPNDPYLQTVFALHVGASTLDAAKETVPVLESLDKIRQLAPEEYQLLVRGYLLLDLPESAAGVLDRALFRYPEDPRFLFEYSSVQWRLGNEEGAYHSIQEYLKKDKSYHTLRECAALARNTGRLDEAIRLFEQASRKASAPEEKGGIHTQLYILKKLRGDAAKDILSHAYEFGKTTAEDPEKDAQYFIMFLTTPAGVDLDDPDVKNWCSETQARMQAFSALHPHFHSFRTFTIDRSKPIGDQFRDTITDIIAKTLPRELATTPMRLAARSVNWPLVLRSTYYPEIHSLFELWEKCIKSKDFEYGIHVWVNQNNLTEEVHAIETSREVCIDITALLSLAELNLLEAFTKKFDRIYIARETRMLLVSEQVALAGPHALAREIDNWRVQNIAKVRIRSSGKTASEIAAGDATVITNAETCAIDSLLGSGVGESLRLSRKLGIPLYSDESSVRIWAMNDYGVKAFSTIALLHHFQRSSLVNELPSLSLQAEMIKRNFRTIPFSAKHLTALLKVVIRDKGKSIDYVALREHPVLSVYLNEFAESVITIDSLTTVAVEWWATIVFDSDLPIECLPACMEGPSRALVMWRTLSGVLAQVEDEPEKRAGALWAGFLWGCYVRDARVVDDVWRSIKDCCNRLFPDSFEKQRTILFDHIPLYIYQIVSRDPGIARPSKLILYVSLPLKLPSESQDREELEKQFFKHSHMLSR